MSSQSETRLLSGPEMSDLLDQLAANIVQSHNGQTGLTLIGIQRGGAHLARRLKERLDKNLKTSLPLGIIDINLYRDDWTRSSIKPRVGKTEIPFSIDNKDVLLIDDVLYTGRTVRAAMDALIDFGRPRRIELLVFVDAWSPRPIATTWSTSTLRSRTAETRWPCLGRVIRLVRASP